MSPWFTGLFIAALLASEYVQCIEERGLPKTDTVHKDNEDDHPDPNDEHHEKMIYVGRLTHDKSERIGFHEPNGIKYIFGTGFDETHKEIEEKDLHLEHQGEDPMHDIPDRSHDTEKKFVHKPHMHKPVDATGPKPYGYVEIHPLDGGVTPPKVVHVDPFFIEEHPVTNKEFGKFVRAVYYETEAEHYGWSFVLASFLPNVDMLEVADVDPEAEDWVAVEGAYWRKPEGASSTYKLREHHPVVHVSHRDAAEYCSWMGRRLPGEREWEAAARAGHWGPQNRTLYSWGDEDDAGNATKHANLWQGDFPWQNTAGDGWRGTSPVKYYPPNKLGLYDMTGNVWEWMRGGKHKARIVRGGSYVDSLDGSVNHAATLGARATLHGTTGSGNVGFRCAKPPKRKVEHHWVYHDETQGAGLQIEDSVTGERQSVGGNQQGGSWEDLYYVEEDDDEFADGEEEFDPDDHGPEDLNHPHRQKRKKKKTVKPRMSYSDEL